jgi:hypothetical protein
MKKKSGIVHMNNNTQNLLIVLVLAKFLACTMLRVRLIFLKKYKDVVNVFF